MTNLLKIENLSVSFRDDDGLVTEAAKNVSLTLERGEILGIAGESGSGKSSVAMSIPRLLPAPAAFYPSGRILFNGVDLLRMTPQELRAVRGAEIGVVFQDPMSSLSPLHKIGGQLSETLRLHREISSAAANEISIEWLSKVGIKNPEICARAYPYELSGGMRQRVMIAMALMLEPSLLIADEPTTALDVTVQSQILNLMEDLHKSDSAILLITHDLGVISQMATKIIVMKDGEIVERSENPDEFFKSPNHPYSQKLVTEARRTELKR
jgi:microcin C transport system ATP-binding protein